MSLRPLGLRRPPSGLDPSLSQYLEELRRAFEGLPFSYFSTTGGPNDSGISAPQGTLGIEINPSSKTHFWFKEDASSFTTGWQSVNLSNAYGSLHHKLDNSVQTQSGVTTNYQQFTAFDTDGISSQISVDQSASYITIQDDGVYEALFDVSFAGTNNTEWDFELFKGSSDEGYGTRVDTGSAGDIVGTAFHSVLTALSGETLAVYVRSDDGGGASLGVSASNFVLKEINTF